MSSVLTTLKSGIGVIVLAALSIAACFGVAYSVSVQFFPFTKERLNLNVGKAVFSMRCQSCHSLAQDGKPKMGPGLANIGADAAVRRPGVSAKDYILESIFEPDVFVAPGVTGQMPSGLLDDMPDYAVRGLLAYLLQYGGESDAQDLLSTEIKRPVRSGLPRLPIRLGSARRGEKLFNEKLGCGSCHGYLGLPGESLLAPSLAQAGLLSEEYLRESLRDPSAVIVPGYEQVIATSSTGEVVAGRLWREDEQSVSVLTSDAQGLWSVKRLLKDDLSTLEKTLASTMPPYQLSVGDRLDLLTFMKSMKSAAGH